MQRLALAVLGIMAITAGCSSDPLADTSWQQEFAIDECDLQATGRSEFFILEPGYQIVLEGGNERVAITVLDETRTIDGVVTRVIEEREWKNNDLIEISRNFFAVCESTGDTFYFGEDVDDYAAGEIVGHGGAWLAGEGDAKAGLIMPGDPAVGMRYYQEIAPGVALDRAEVVSVNETLTTPAGTFTDALKTEESSGLKNERDFKTYARGIGLIQDEALLLVEYGFVSG